VQLRRVREPGPLEINALAVFLERVAGHAHDTRALEAPQEVLEGAAVERAVAERLAVKAPRGLAVVPRERAEDLRERRALGAAGLAEAAGHALLRRANIADSARMAGVLLVAEMLHEVEHPAAVRLGEARHLVELAELDPAARYRCRHNRLGRG